MADPIGLTVLLAAGLLFHPDSISSSRLDVAGSQVELRVRCQALSLLEVVEGLDADGDGALTSSEVDAKQAEIVDYIGTHYRIETGAGHELAPRPIDVRHRAAGFEEGIVYRGGRVEVELIFEDAEPIRDLRLEVSLFTEAGPEARLQGPDHIDLATVAWAGRAPQLLVFDHANPVHRLNPEGRGVFGAFLLLGIRHILGGWDHLAFLAALILGASGLRSLLGVVTAFTVAHSITLVLSALGVVDLSAHRPLVEFLIAVSIAYVAADTALHPGARRGRWPEAMVFGLLHGLGFASFLGQSLVDQEARTVPLLAFNLGVESGQIAVAVLMVLVLRWCPRSDDPGEPFIAPRRVRIAGSVILTVLGLWWAVERLVSM